jgi:hypothetical protein
MRLNAFGVAIWPLLGQNKKYAALGVSPAVFADTDSFPKQENIRRFRSIVVDSAVLEHNGGLVLLR